MTRTFGVGGRVRVRARRARRRVGRGAGESEHEGRGAPRAALGRLPPRLAAPLGGGRSPRNDASLLRSRAGGRPPGRYKFPAARAARLPAARTSPPRTATHRRAPGPTPTPPGRRGREESLGVSARGRTKRATGASGEPATAPPRVRLRRRPPPRVLARRSGGAPPPRPAPGREEGVAPGCVGPAAVLAEESVGHRPVVLVGVEVPRLGDAPVRDVVAVAVEVAPRAVSIAGGGRARATGGRRLSGPDATGGAGPRGASDRGSGAGLGWVPCGPGSRGRARKWGLRGLRGGRARGGRGSHRPACYQRDPRVPPP